MMVRHVADALRDRMPVVYPAMSKHYFYYKHHVSTFVLREGAVPLHPFMLFDYFFIDALPRDVVRRANNNVVRISDEVWVFGPIADGVASEVRYAKEQGKPVRYFSLEKLPDEMIEISEEEVEFEEGLGPEDLKA